VLTAATSAVTSSRSLRNVARNPVATSSTTPRRRGVAAPPRSLPPASSWRRTMKVLTHPTIWAGLLNWLRVALRPPSGGVCQGDGHDVEFAHAPGVGGIAPARFSVPAQAELPCYEGKPGVLVVWLPLQQLAQVLAG
jgi:hypothetical protein